MPILVFSVSVETYHLMHDHLFDPGYRHALCGAAPICVNNRPQGCPSAAFYHGVHMFL